MLDNEEIDAVSIATPDAFHKDPALAAIRHGKPILVEKPLATTSEPRIRSTNPWIYVHGRYH